MKRLLAIAALTVGLGAVASAQAPSRTLTYGACGVWGCATLQLSGSLTYGFSMFDAATERWFYQGSVSAVGTVAASGVAFRTDGWTFNDFVGMEASLHRYAGVWGEPYVERADFSTDFFAPTVSGHIDTCADPSRVLCNAGYTDYGTNRLELVSISTPEPTTLALFATGLVGFYRATRRLRRQTL